jgi:L-aminopeptidase/D-esterase-like protein
MNDGDTVFALATGRDDLVIPVTDSAFRSTSSRPAALNGLLEAGARVFARACSDAVMSAVGVGGPPAYRDLCPSVVARAFPDGS